MGECALSQQQCSVFIESFQFFQHSLSEFMKESIGIKIPRSNCPLTEQMCPNIQSSILIVIIAYTVYYCRAKMEHAEVF